jgi:peptidoglycan/LPS O-acetylase OafA/YrhL
MSVVCEGRKRIKKNKQIEYLRIVVAVLMLLMHAFFGGGGGGRDGRE